MTFALTRVQLVSVILLFAVYLLFGLLPHFGPPHFRYTGSDLAHHVWNLGWPLATCIYDSANSPFLFISPFAYIYAVFGVFLFGSFYIGAMIWTNRRRPATPKRVEASL